MPIDEKFLAGVERFNSGRYFEAHEEWEALWHRTRGPEREALQGLIQAAVVLHHLREGRLKGARTLYPSARRRLRAHGPRLWGADLEALVARLDRLLAPLLARSREELPGRAAPGPAAPFDAARAPRIILR